MTLVNHDRIFYSRLIQAFAENPTIRSHEELARVMQIDWFSYKQSFNRLLSY